MTVKKILVSPGYGAGWSTWSDDKHKEVAEYQPIIEFLESGGKAADLDDVHPLIMQMKQDLDLSYFYMGGAGQLEVRQVSGRYRIEEYDGSEYVVTEDDLW